MNRSKYILALAIIGGLLSCGDDDSEDSNADCFEIDGFVATNIRGDFFNPEFPGIPLQENPVDDDWENLSFDSEFISFLEIISENNVSVIPVDVVEFNELDDCSGSGGFPVEVIFVDVESFTNEVEVEVGVNSAPQSGFAVLERSFNGFEFHTVDTVNVVASNEQFEYRLRDLQVEDYFGSLFYRVVFIDQNFENCSFFSPEQINVNEQKLVRPIQISTTQNQSFVLQARSSSTSIISITDECMNNLYSTKVEGFGSTFLEINSDDYPEVFAQQRVRVFYGQINSENEVFNAGYGDIRIN